MHAANEIIGPRHVATRPLPYTCEGRRCSISSDPPQWDYHNHPTTIQETREPTLAEVREGLRGAAARLTYTDFKGVLAWLRAHGGRSVGGPRDAWVQRRARLSAARRVPQLTLAQRLAARKQARADTARQAEEARKASLAKRRAPYVQRVAQAVRSHFDSLSFRVGSGDYSRSVVVDFGRGETAIEPHATSSTSRGDRYSSRCTYRKLDVTHTIHVRSSWIRDVQDIGLALVDGLLTLDARPIPARRLPVGVAAAWTAIWVRQGVGTSLVTERGVMVRDRCGCTVHGPDLPTAARTLARRAQEAATITASTAANTADRTWRSLAQIGEAAKLATLTVFERALPVGLSESRSAGNSATGTRDWSERHLGGAEITTVWALLCAAYATTDRGDLALRVAWLAVKTYRERFSVAA